MAQRTKHSYFIVMEDHGKNGLEAIVHPEETRRAIVDRLKKGDYTPTIAFIHHVDDLLIEDVTAELFNEAEIELRAEHIASRADRLANTQDHNRKLVREAV
ncbi:hypothetical protein [Bradyrhizobium elkanii]|uniref:hypothetical protein n=1 Tax=Bradyrhizobium elkanii TaxID=29448 RepID=UPI003D262741